MRDEEKRDDRGSVGERLGRIATLASQLVTDRVFETINQTCDVAEVIMQEGPSFCSDTAEDVVEFLKEQNEGPSGDSACTDETITDADSMIRARSESRHETPMRRRHSTPSRVRFHHSVSPPANTIDDITCGSGVAYSYNPESVESYQWVPHRQGVGLNDSNPGLVRARSVQISKFSISDERMKKYHRRLAKQRRIFSLGLYEI